MAYNIDTEISQERLVRKEVALGAIREIPPPMAHIGLSIAPFKDVQSDDVIFSYISPDVDGLAPARAEDAESELAVKDDMVGTGRASVIDWAEKDHYDPSDVSRYREYLQIAQLVEGGGQFPLTIGNMTDDFAGKIARDTARRKRKLDNRIELLIMGALDTGVITYASNRINFTVDFLRPANQQAQTPANGLWNGATPDPINDFLALDEFMYGAHSVRMGSAIGSRKAWLQMLNSPKFAALSGLAGFPGGTPVDPAYLIPGWRTTPDGVAADQKYGGGIEAVLGVFQRATGVTPIVYDAVYRTRAAGSKTTVNHRFTADNRITFLPEDEYITEVAQDEIGFAKTLTSPHPEGNWTPGYYEWEKDTGPDPWGRDIGSGIKAFPVFPHMEFTYSMTVF